MARPPGGPHPLPACGRVSTHRRGSPITFAPTSRTSNSSYTQASSSRTTRPSLRPSRGGFLLDAVFDCEGGILVHARKLARVVSDAEGDDPVVETAWYSYNVSLRGVGNIVRYDSPFLPDSGGHHASHHVHRYNVLAGDMEGRIQELEAEHHVPHLGEVIREARDWYFGHIKELQARGML